MNKLRLLLVSCAMLLGVMVSQAEVRWGVTAVGNISTLNFNQQLFTVDQEFGYGAGLTGEIIIPGIGFAVDASILYSQVGATLHLGECNVWSYDGYGNERLYIHNIEIPLNLKFKYTNLNGVENTIAPLVYVGPTFAIHVADNGVGAMDYSGGSFGLHVGAGCELIRRLQVSASYTWGITSTLKTVKLDDFSAKNNYWRISVSYMF